MGKRLFTDEQEAEICRRYEGGEKCAALATELGISQTTVLKITKKLGGKICPRGGQPVFSNEQEKEICELYLDGENVRSIARTYGVDHTTILSNLQRLGVERRSRNDYQKLLSPEAELQVCERYLAGENSVELAEEFGVRSSTIARMLERHGIDRRPAAPPRRFSTKQETQICAEYKSGATLNELGNSHQASNSTIQKILIRHEIERREKGGEDNLQYLLDGLFRGAEKEAEFYIYKLKNYDGYLKAGVESTGHRADREYGEQQLSIFGERHEIWLLEQAILKATKRFAACPSDLADRRWPGWTEVRQMNPDALIKVATALHEQLLELGMWLFAAQFVPMTAQQRQECLLRAA